MNDLIEEHKKLREENIRLAQELAKKKKDVYYLERIKRRQQSEISTLRSLLNDRIS